MPLQGSLGHLGLADLLQTGLTGQAEGLLTLRNGAARASLYVADDGLYLVEPEVLDPEELLRAFVTRDLISQTAIDKARRKVGSGLALVDHLSSLGAIPQGELMDVLAGTAEDTILDLLTWDHGEFRFEEGARERDLGGLVGRVGVDPGGVMLRAAQRMDERASIAGTVGMNATLFVALPVQPPTAESEGDPTPEVYACLDGHAVIDEVALLLGIGRFAALKAAYELVQAGAARIASESELSQAAESRANQKQYRIARLLLLQWVDAAPADPEPVRRTVRVAVARGRLQEEIDATCWLGHLYIGLGQPADAVREIRQSLERHPQQRRLLRSLRDAAEAAGDVQAFAMGTIRMADAALKDGEPEAAARLLEPLVAAQPNGLSVRVQYAKALVKCNDHDGVVSEAEAVLKLLGRKCKRRDERETASFFREAIAGIAPERTDLLRKFRGLTEIENARGKRVALVVAMVGILATAGVVLWPPSASSLLEKANASWSNGDRSEAQRWIGELIERYPESAEAEAAFVLQARILNPTSTAPTTVKVDRELANRLKKLTPTVRKAMERLPEETSHAIVESLIEMLDTPEGRGLRRKAVRDLAPDVRRAIRSMERDCRARTDLLGRAAEAPARLRTNPNALRAYLAEADQIRQDTFTHNLRAAVDLMTRFVGMYEQDELVGALRELDRVARGLSLAISSSADPLVECRRVLTGLELERFEREIRERAPSLVVNGKLADADALYQKLEELVKAVKSDALMSRIMTNLERRRVPHWLRTKRAQIQDIRVNLKAAKAAEDAGDLKAAAHAYVGLIRKYEYIRFETVFSLPLRVKTIPEGAKIQVNGEDVQGEIVRYAWGSQTTVTATAPGYAAETVLLRTAEDDADTEITLRLGPKPAWTAPVEPTVEIAPVEVDHDVVTMDRSGRIARYDFHSGKILWARHYESLEGVRARPVLAGSSIHVAMVDGHVLFLDPNTGNKRGEVSIERPVGNMAVQNDIVGLATLRGEFIGIRNRGIAYRKPLSGTPHSGTLGAHGAFWVGTNDGSVLRVDARTGESRTIELRAGHSPVTGLASASAGILVTTAGGSIVYLSAAGGIRWAKQDVGDIIGQGAEAGDIVAVADRRGRVLYFSSGNGDPQGGVDLNGSPLGGLVTVGGVIVAVLDSGQLWGFDAVRKQVRFDVELGGTASFPIGVIQGTHLVVSRKGMQMSLVRLPPALDDQ